MCCDIFYKTREREFWFCMEAVHVRRKSISKPLNLTIYTQKQKNFFDSQWRVSNWFVLGKLHCSEPIYFKVQVVWRKSCVLRTWKSLSCHTQPYQGKVLLLNWDVEMCYTHRHADTHTPSSHTVICNVFAIHCFGVSVSVFLAYLISERIFFLIKYSMNVKNSKEIWL